MEQTRSLHTVILAIFLLHISLAQVVPFWGYECVDRECVRVEVTESNRDSVLGLNACSLSCIEFGTLVPQPRDVIEWNNTIVSVSRSNIRVEGVESEQHQKYWNLSMERFNGILDAKIQDNELSQGVYSILIEVNIDNASIELTMETNEQYELASWVDEANSEIRFVIKADTYFGARHALETISQLIVYDEFSNQLKTLSAATLKDDPAYRHRGILLDTSRRFYSVAAIKRTLDVMAMSKLNVFHWHITDSQSFAMVLNSHPELAAKGASGLGKVYYPSDIRDIVDYAFVRGIRIIPELDAPAHVAEGFQNTNLVTCMHAQPWHHYCAGPPCGQFDPTKDELYDLLHDLYSEMYEMFNEPSLFHMGGDEVFMSCWNSSADVRNWMIEHGWGLTNEDYLKLWDYFQVKALELYRGISSEDRKIILWTSSLTEEENIDEFLSPDDYIIQIWTVGTGRGSHIPHILERGYDIIISNHDKLYLDCGFGNWVDDGINWCAPYKPWHAIYDNNFRDMVGNRTSQVLGGEVCSWSEPTDEGTIDARLWPRASAFAERLWSDPNTNFRGAEHRILLHREFLVQYGINAESIQPDWCVRNQGDCPYNN